MIDYKEKVYEGIEIRYSSRWALNILIDSFWILDLVDKAMIDGISCSDYIINEKREYTVSFYLKPCYKFQKFHKDNRQCRVLKHLTEDDLYGSETVEIERCNYERTIESRTTFTDYRYKCNEDGFLIEQDKYDEIVIRTMFEYNAEFLIKNKPSYNPQIDFNNEILRFDGVSVNDNLEEMKNGIKSMEDVLNDERYADCENKDIIIDKKKKIEKAVSLREKGMQRLLEDKKEYQFVYRYVRKNKIMYVGQTSSNKEDGWKSRHTSHLAEDLPYRSCDYIEVARVENSSTKNIYETYYINKPDKNGDLPLWNIADAGQATSLILPELDFKKYRIKDLKQIR